MKIVAYSKVPATAPFVHLGYVAASTTKPVQGLIAGGVILLVGGLALSGRQLWRQRKPSKYVTPEGLCPRRRFRLAHAMFVSAFLVVLLAYVFGEKVFVYPQKVTSLQMHVAKRDIAKLSEPGSDASQITALPAQEGEYDLTSLLGADGKGRYKDGWNTPLRLRATHRDGRLAYVVVSAGPDRVMGTEDDMTSPDN